MLYKVLVKQNLCYQVKHSKVLHNIKVYYLGIFNNFTNLFYSFFVTLKLRSMSKLCLFYLVVFSLWKYFKVPLQTVKKYTVALQYFCIVFSAMHLVYIVAMLFVFRSSCLGPQKALDTSSTSHPFVFECTRPSNHSAYHECTRISWEFKCFTSVS